MSTTSTRSREAASPVAAEWMLIEFQPTMGRKAKLTGKSASTRTYLRGAPARHKVESLSRGA